MVTSPLDFHAAGVATAKAIGAIHKRGVKFSIKVGRGAAGLVRVEIAFRSALTDKERQGLVAAVLNSTTAIEVNWSEVVSYYCPNKLATESRKRHG